MSIRDLVLVRKLAALVAAALALVVFGTLVWGFGLMVGWDRGAAAIVAVLTTTALCMGAVAVAIEHKY